MNPILSYFGHHKCGTSWICRMVHAVCAATGRPKVACHGTEHDFGSDIERNLRNHPFGFWCYVNANALFVRGVNVRGFHVVRDPRDVIVSGYYSHKATHPLEGWPRLAPFRKHLDGLNEEDGLLAELSFASPCMYDMYTWDYTTPGVMEVRFEDLVENPLHWVGAAFGFMGIGRDVLPDADLERIVKENSFEVWNGRKPGQEDRTSHYRMGVAGDWRNHLTPKVKDEFKALYNPILLKLGYEHNANW